MVATIFAERPGQWLTQADVMRWTNKKFGDSTIRKAFRKLSQPIDVLNGHSFIDTEFVKNKDRGGPILRGQLSDAATEKIFASVTPVDRNLSSYFIREKQLELPPLSIGDQYISPKDIINFRIQKSGEEYTRGLLNKMAKDKPGSDKEALEILITHIAESSGIEFNAVSGQIKKDGQVFSPDANLAKVRYQWEQLHGIDEPYTIASDVLKGHHCGRIPNQQRKFTDLGMQVLATDENRYAYSGGILIVDNRQDRERVHTIAEMAKKGDEVAFEGLIRILSSDDSKYARQEAARSLGSLNDPRVIEPLIKAMLGDEYDGVRSVAAQGLEKFGYRQEFAQVLSSDPDPYVRRVVTEILGRIGDLRAVDLLIKALHDSDRGVQCSAAITLGKIGDIRAVDALISKLKCEDDDIRRTAFVALGDIGGPRAIEVLRNHDDPSTFVREKVIDALEKLELKGLSQ